jgi:P pilus assembly chaperone PapD
MWKQKFRTINNESPYYITYTNIIVEGLLKEKLERKTRIMKKDAKMIVGKKTN